MELWVLVAEDGFRRVAEPVDHQNLKDEMNPNIV